MGDWPSDRNMICVGPAGADAKVERATRMALLNAVPAPLLPRTLWSYRPMFPRVTLRTTVSTRGRASPPVNAGGRKLADPDGDRSAAAAWLAKTKIGRAHV